jgi:hypothetical protein
MMMKTVNNLDFHPEQKPERINDVAEAAYWHFKMMTDPTQRQARVAKGYRGDPLSERDAFKACFGLGVDTYIKAQDDLKV